MPPTRDTFCSFCGTRYEDSSRYPRRCGSCGVQVWANPIPVGVLLQPVRHAGEVGLLVLRRGIEPRKGMLALVGGFLEEHESWQQGCAREAKEELDLAVDPRGLRPFWFVSSAPRPHRVLLFAVADLLESSALGAFAASEEATERGLVYGVEGLEEHFAFPLHLEAARRFFEERGVRGAHRYHPLP